jgi:transcriptional regulator with XRE-family HTH domain
LRVVLDARAALAGAHLSARFAEEDGDEQWRSLQEKWTRSHGELADRLYSEGDEFADAAIADYFDRGDESDYDLPADVRNMLADSLLEYRRAGDVIEAGVQRVKRSTLQEPHKRFNDELEAWYKQACVGEGASLAEWPQILKAWRTATGRTTREAADALDISASAIVRYETGKRTAAPPYIDAMIRRMAGASAAPPDTSERRRFRSFARDIDDDEKLDPSIASIAALDPTAHVEAMQRRGVKLEAFIDEHARLLSVAQKRVLALLISRPAAIDAIEQLIVEPPTNPIEPVLDALGDDVEHLRQVAQQVRR